MKGNEQDTTPEVLKKKLKEQIKNKEEQLDINKRAREIQEKVNRLNLKMRKLVAENPKMTNPQYEIENDAEALALRKEASLLELERAKIQLGQEAKEWKKRYEALENDLEDDKKRLADIEEAEKSEAEARI